MMSKQEHKFKFTDSICRINFYTEVFIRCKYLKPNRLYRLYDKIMSYKEPFDKKICIWGILPII